MKLSEDIKDYRISTKTVIASSNVNINISRLFKEIVLESRQNDNYQIICMYHQTEIKQNNMYPQVTSASRKSFRNALNVIMSINCEERIDKKLKCVNFKVSKNGKFQMTGCRSEIEAQKALFAFLETAFHVSPTSFEFLDGSHILQIYFQTVMTNIGLYLGFCVNRQKLDNLMNSDTPFYSLLETSFGYTGVNIKFPLDMEWWKLAVPTASCDIRQSVWMWTCSEKPLCELVSSETMDKMKQKKKYNTFLLFHSGNVIMSGMLHETMKDHFQQFVQLMKEWKSQIEENCELVKRR